MQYVITLMQNKYIHFQIYLRSLYHAFGVILNTLHGVGEET